jgi:hypothetical protein
VNDGPEGPGGCVPERHEGFLRPRFEILGEESLVPDANLVRPAPDRFTHELVRPEPYSYGADEGPAGQLPAGTRVVLMEDDGSGRCRVVDGRGLYVEVARDSLRKLPEA